jgi:hypothetical protein
MSEMSVYFNETTQHTWKLMISNQYDEIPVQPQVFLPCAWTMCEQISVLSIRQKGLEIGNYINILSRVRIRNVYGR